MPTQDLIKFGSSIPCKLILNIPLQKINHQEISHLNENAFEETPRLSTNPRTYKGKP